jgi:hypothetical protein
LNSYSEEGREGREERDQERKKGSVLVELLHSSDATLKLPSIHTNKHDKFNIFF